MQQLARQCTQLQRNFMQVYVFTTLAAYIYIRSRSAKRLGRWPRNRKLASGAGVPVFPLAKPCLIKSPQGRASISNLCALRKGGEDKRKTAKAEKEIDASCCAQGVHSLPIHFPRLFASALCLGTGNSAPIRTASMRTPHNGGFASISCASTAARGGGYRRASPRNCSAPEGETGAPCETAQ